MTIFQACFAAAAVVFLLYLVMPERKAKAKAAPAQSSRTARKNRAKQIGAMTGLMGGSIEDGMMAQHALDRAHGDAANATDRDVATAVGMQSAQGPN